jgi:hypothetical protein
MSEKWVTISEASQILKDEGVNASISKLSRLASSGKIKSDTDHLDERVRLVDIEELRIWFKSSKRYRA